MRKVSLMKMMSLAMTVAVLIVEGHNSSFFGIGEPKLPAKFGQ